MIDRKHVTQTLILASTLSLVFGCSGPALEKKDQTNHETGNIQQPLVESEATMTADAVAPTPVVSMESRSARMHMNTTKAMATSPAYMPAPPEIGFPPQTGLTTESYTPVGENRFINVLNDPLSTFSIDVDTASYANVRRFINGGSLPPTGAIRIEEMINYFSYTYPQPTSGPFSLSAELGPAPWNPNHKLVKIGLKAKEIKAEELPPSNLVFLIDVSGSMNHPNKLPLLKQSMLMLVEQLTANDRVSIVVYAGADKVVLPPTSGEKKERIKQTISNLTSSGSTHGSSGIRTAYELAEQARMINGNNRVILASDGDFNVGITTRGELKQLIEEKRKTGTYLTVLGFGMGNYHDDTMEILADSGNGNYAYIDSLLEAKKVLIKERASTLYALAKDVKIQVEFNPSLVGAYRLIGYENRMLADEDFKDDRKDAGEIGLGHAVTALYEIIPADGSDIPEVDNLKYQRPEPQATDSEEVLTLKLRYKPIGQDSSLLETMTVENKSIELSSTSDDFRFASSVAGFGMLLKGSEYIKKMDFTELLALAKSGRGNDEEGYRAEFIRLIEMAQLLQ